MEVKHLIVNTIQTKRLMLRKMDMCDANSLFAIWSNPKVTKYMNIEGFTRIKEAEEMIAFLSDLSERGEAIRYSIIEKNSNTIIGSCGFNSLNFEANTAEIGYDLDSQFWNKGYGTEAVNGLVDYAFHQLNLKIIEAKVDPRNILSIKLLQKLNFEFQGIVEENAGQADDLYLYTKESHIQKSPNGWSVSSQKD